MFGQVHGFNLQTEYLRERRCKQERYEALNVVQKFVNGEEINKIS